jgi:hypothetical protein
VEKKSSSMFVNFGDHLEIHPGVIELKKKKVKSVNLGAPVHSLSKIDVGFVANNLNIGKHPTSLHLSFSSLFTYKRPRRGREGGVRLTEEKG